MLATFRALYRPYMDDQSDDRVAYKVDDAVITVGDLRKVRAITQEAQP